MTETFGWLSLLPAVVAIGMALWKKKILPALFLGILIGEIIKVKGNVFSAFFMLLDDAVRITGDKGNLELILFGLMVGGLLALIKMGRGFEGFVRWLENRRQQYGKRTVFGLTYLIGICMFLENYSNILINGTTVAPLYDKLRISRERLAYFIHTLSINTVALVVVNSWGAFFMSLLAGQQVSNPFSIVIKAVPFNFYCISSLIMVGVVMTTGLTIGPMRKVKPRPPLVVEVKKDEKTDAVAASGIQPRMFNMLLPISVLIVSVITSLYLTGNGSISQGAGTTSVFYAVVVSLFVTSGFYIVKKMSRFQAIMDTIFKGMGEFFEIGALIVLALTLGDICKSLGTGLFIAEFAKQSLPIFLIPGLFFLLSCVMAFATGTSYGTFSIMIPIAVPMASLVGINPSLMFAACISGGVFGDNCSPISDTSIITSVAADCNVVDHVRTQLPYAVLSAAVAFVLFIIMGFIA